MLPNLKYLYVVYSYFTELLFSFPIDFIGFANTAIFHYFFPNILALPRVIPEVLLGILISFSDSKGNSVSFPMSRLFAVGLRQIFFYLLQLL